MTWILTPDWSRLPYCGHRGDRRLGVSQLPLLCKTRWASGLSNLFDIWVNYLFTPTFVHNHLRMLYSLLLPDFWMKVKDFMFRGNLGFCDTEVILMVILQSVRGIIIWDMKQFHFIITNSSSLLVVGQNHQPGWFDQIVGWSQYNGHFNTIFTN